MTPQGEYTHFLALKSAPVISRETSISKFGCLFLGCRAAAAFMMGEDLHKFSRSRLDNGRADSNPASRQIYLTFPADSTFREEDVSNYFK